jgi:hypothetical protein
MKICEGEEKIVGSGSDGTFGEEDGFLLVRGCAVGVCCADEWKRAGAAGANRSESEVGEKRVRDAGHPERFCPNCSAELKETGAS